MSSEAPHPPRQSRSREKLERILSAAEVLLEDKLFEHLTMAEVARAAEVAVGTIYTRFKTKEELLPVLFARHDEAVVGRVEDLFRRMGRGKTLAKRIETVVSFAVDYHVKHRGLLRALTMFVRAHPDSVPAATWTAREAQYEHVARAVIADGSELRARDPLPEVMFHLGILNSVCREQLLFGEVTPLRGRRPSLATFKRRLARLILSDLTHSAPPSPKRP